jgi:peptide/nickel transport system substrate-binding protein
MLVLSACGGSGDSDSGSSQGDSTSAGKLEGNLPTGKEAGPDQEISIASPYPPITLDPQFSSDPGLNTVTWRINEGLTYRNAAGEFVPALASEMPKQIGPTTWEVKLVEDAEFSDGTPFNADAAVFSIERIIDPDYGTGLAEPATLKGAEKVDDYTIRLHTLEPDPILDQKLHSVKMVDPKNPDIENDPIGTGPYMLESYSPGSEAVLVASPTYRGEQPQVTKVRIKFIPDEGTRLQAMQAGEADLVPTVSPDQLGQLDHYVPSEGPVWSSFARLNSHDDLLSDQKVREALNYAVDKQAIVDGLFAGFGEVSPCQVAGFQPDADRSLEPYPYDPEKAKELVEEAGATGKKLTIDWSSGYFTMDRPLGELLQEQLGQTGLDVTVRFNPGEKHLEKAFVTGADGDQATYFGSTDPLGDISRNVILWLKGEGPVSVYENKQLDAKIAAAETEEDTTKRSERFREVLADACDQAALLYLVDWADLFALSDRLTWNPGVYSTGGRWAFDDMTVVEPGT